MVGLIVGRPCIGVVPADLTDAALVGGPPSVLLAEDLPVCPPPCGRPDPASLDCLPAWRPGERLGALQPKPVEIVGTCEAGGLQVDIAKG
jgi:hypothetical protein